jgi:hypothetical protein
LLFARPGTPGESHKAARRKAKFAPACNAALLFHCY